MSSEFAGTLRERVAIGTAGAQDAAGGAGDPVFGAPLWASVEAEKPLPGVAGEHLAAPSRYLIAMRSEGAPRVGDHLQWRGERLVVIAVTRDPLRPGRVLLRAEARP